VRWSGLNANGITVPDTATVWIGFKAPLLRSSASTEMSPLSALDT
jgi:hypothetical protein